MKHSPLLLLQRTVNNRFKRAQLYPGESCPQSCDLLALHMNHFLSPVTHSLYMKHSPLLLLQRTVYNRVKKVQSYPGETHSLYMKHSPLLLLQCTDNNRFKRAQLYPGESFPHSCDPLTLHETFTSSTMTMPCQRPSQKGTALSRRIISSVLCPTRFA